MSKKSVLVVVGTTKFEDLIKAVSEKRFQKLLFSKGYTHLSIQIGHGEYTPAESGSGRGEELIVDWFRFKPTLANDMTEASLIISHGGSGTIFESLSLRKALVVVINETLMNNHQTELASRLAKDGHLVYTFSKYVHFF
ncbi:PREDICTED: UDP-N-acetylglucosamine transferase subunit ALG13 homolog, partial [Amphimedon queenslandica]|uniref:Glycosyl transferase family 28 C-terminal domain-containing protein n=1 Tax=Amphimedon queenslandica TaxID=400682 RepID=A0AAN0K2Q2_AMPQE